MRPGALGRTCFVYASALTLAAGVAGTDTARCQTAIASDQHKMPTQQAVLQDLATAQRMLADEEFVDGDRKAASAHYDDADRIIDQLQPDGVLLSPAQKQLLDDEIEYRKLLLSRNSSFWGLQFATKPVNPMAAIAQFDNTFGKFSDRVRDVDQLQLRIANNDTSAVQMDDAQMRADRDQRVEDLKGDIASVTLRDADSRRHMYEDRKNAIQQLQIAIQQEIQSLQQQIASRDASINSLLMQAAARELGLPPDTVAVLKGASKRDYSGIISAVAQKYIASPDSLEGLGPQITQLAAEAEDAARQYQEARDTVADVKVKADKAAALLKAVQSNDRDQLIAIGAQALGQMSASTQAQLAAGLGHVSDIKQALELAGQGTNVRREMAAYAGRVPSLSSNVAPLVRGYLDLANEQFVSHYQSFLQAEVGVAQTTNARAVAFRAFSRAWARSLVQDVIRRQGHVAQIAGALGAVCSNDDGCADWLTTQVAQNGLGGPIVQVAGAGDVTLTVNGQTTARFSIAELSKTFHGRAIETDAAVVKQDVNAFAQRVQGGGPNLVAAVLDRLPDVDFDRDIGPRITALGAPELATLKRALSAPAGGGGASAIVHDSLALSVGRDIARQTIFKGVAPGPPAHLLVLPSLPSTGPGADPSQQAIMTAMAASGPYGAAAAMAIQVFSGIAQNGVAIEEINAKAQEDHDLTVEMLHVTVFEQDLNKDEAIARLGQRIAQADYNTAVERSTFYQSALLDQGAQNTALRAKIRARLPLIFLLEEELREEFDAVDHSLGFWENDLSADSDYLQRTIRSDPQARRLALDPDISLYNWFNRTTEGERADLDALLTHWQGLEALISTNLCPRIHCTKHDGQLGQVEMTDLVSLRGLVGEATWKTASSTHRHSLQFTLLPQNLPGMPARDGLRLVNLTAGVASPAGGYAAVPNLVFQHSGLGYVTIAGRGYRETLESSRGTAPAQTQGNDVASNLKASLQSRWSNSMETSWIEGYPLFGLYQVTFPPNFDFSKDLTLRFYYQWPLYVSNPPAAGVPIRFKCKDYSGKPVPITSPEVSLLMGQAADGSQTIGDPSCSLSEPSE